MKIAIRRMGNSQGVIIPKPVLAQAGLAGEVELSVEKGAIVLRKPAAGCREGWAESSKRIADAGDDAVVWPEFGNEADKDIKW
jgi:antitoxin MazE